jgi:hypothetical protein
MLALLPALLASCSAISPSREGKSVELVTEKPAANCKQLDRAIGSQGNWLTGDYTPSKDLFLGARNDLRNKAAEMGGNTVWVYDTGKTNARHSRGTTNSTVSGIVYRCE